MKKINKDYWWVFAILLFVLVTAVWSTAATITHTLTAPSDTTVAPGEVLGPFSSSITNSSSSAYTFFMYTYLYTPDGQWVQIMPTIPLTLFGNQTISKSNLSLPIPSIAQTGTTYYCVSIYDTSSNLLDYDYFSLYPSSTLPVFFGHFEGIRIQ